MTAADWRDARAEDLAPLYAAERCRWLGALQWDLADILRVTEQSRAAGHLPGVILRDETGRATGWAFYLLHNRVLQIGAINAPSAAGVRRVLDAILGSPEAGLAQSVSCFVFPCSPSVTSALVRQRFDLAEHLYLTAPVTAVAADRGGHGLRPWGPGDDAAAVRLMARAYAGDASARCFTPNARLDEWAAYLGQILTTPGVGTLVPDASLVGVVEGAGAPAGVVLTTQIARGVAHIAQVAVDPAARGRGLGRRLVQAAAAEARQLGYRHVSLLVAASNAPARALYGSLGFRLSATFLFGTRGAVRRLHLPRARHAGAAREGATAVR